MKFILTLFVNLTFSLIVLGQNAHIKDETKLSPKQVRSFSGEIYNLKPKLTLQDAVKVMEQYLKKEKIDTSKYYLWEVKLIRSGSDEEKRPAWRFWWLSEKGSVGDYIVILVFMDKKAERIPSM